MGGNPQDPRYGIAYREGANEIHEFARILRFVGYGCYVSREMLRIDLVVYADNIFGMIVTYILLGEIVEDCVLVILGLDEAVFG